MFKNGAEFVYVGLFNLIDEPEKEFVEMGEYG